MSALDKKKNGDMDVIGLDILMPEDVVAKIRED